MQDDGILRAAARRGGDSWLNRGLLTLCLLAAALVGCRNEASTAGTAATQSGDSTFQVAQVPSAEPSSPESAPKPAGPVEPVELEATVLAPKITVEKPVLDLGEIGTETKRTDAFRFTNTGNAPLKILQVHQCCGVATRGVAAGQEYAPGESGALEFDYLTGSTPVPAATRQLQLKTNDPEQSLVSLTIKAAVVRRVEHTPQSDSGCS